MALEITDSTIRKFLQKASRLLLIFGLLGVALAKWWLLLLKNWQQSLKDK